MKYQQNLKITKYSENQRKIQMKYLNLHIDSYNHSKMTYTMKISELMKNEKYI